MKKVFLDFGANKGQGLREFIRMYNINSDWIVESFEPDPSCELEKHISDIPFVKIHKKAIFNKNGKIKFHQFLLNSEASSVNCLLDSGYFTDPNHDYYLKNDEVGKFIEVDCVDVTDILNQYNDDDFIVVKLDVEGSEFTILRKMIKDNVINKINELYVEWHTPLLSTETPQSEMDLREIISETGVKLHNWY
jgi:FkbM family methyltransferase